ESDAPRNAGDPAPERADGAVGAAAHEAEGGVERRHGAPARYSPCGSAPYEKAAERHDEGGNAHIGDDVAMQSADRGTEHNAERKRQDPDRGMAEAQPVRQDLRLRHAHNHADEAEKRADGKVDI